MWEWWKRLQLVDHRGNLWCYNHEALNCSQCSITTLPPYQSHSTQHTQMDVVSAIYFSYICSGPTVTFFAGGKQNFNQVQWRLVFGNAVESWIVTLIAESGRKRKGEHESDQRHSEISPWLTRLATMRNFGMLYDRWVVTATYGLDSVIFS